MVCEADASPHCTGEAAKRPASDRLICLRRTAADASSGAAPPRGLRARPVRRHLKVPPQPVFSNHEQYNITKQGLEKWNTAIWGKRTDLHLIIAIICPCAASDTHSVDIIQKVIRLPSLANKSTDINNKLSAMMYQCLQPLYYPQTTMCHMLYICVLVNNLKCVFFFLDINII